MLTLRRIGIGAAILAVLMGSTATAFGQNPIVEWPPRDNPSAPIAAGRISGRVVDAQGGLPLHDTQVRLTGGVRPERIVGTDDDGRFEFDNLPVGRFMLIASKPGHMTLEYGQRRPFEPGKPIDLREKQTLDDADLALPRGGVIVAHVTDEFGEPLSGVRITVERYRYGDTGGQRRLGMVGNDRFVTDDRGEVRIFGLPPADYYVKAVTSAEPMPDASPGHKRYVPTYFPGTTGIATAEPVAVQVAKEVNVDIPLVPVPISRLTGTVRRENGSSALAAGTYVIIEGEDGSGRFGSIDRTDASFTVPDVTPGDYVLTARSFDPDAQRAEWEQGRVRISVTGGDITGVLVPMTHGGSIRGRVVFESERPSESQFTSVYPSITSVNVVTMFPPHAKDDGTFSIDAIFAPGMVRVDAAPSGWFLKAVRLGDRDVTDVALGRPGTEIGGVEIVLTRARGEVSGSVVDGLGAATSDYTVIVFPEDRSQWTLTSRFLFNARPDREGQFKIRGLPPGRYLVAAADYVETRGERDPELLERLRSKATAVSLSDGDVQTVTLTLATTP